MATESPNSQNPVPAISTPVTPLNMNVVVKHDATDTEVEKIKATDAAAEIPFPLRSESVREEQVQNAVKFLSHPEVRGSPKIYMRSFLEKQGLTKEEIYEAFRLVLAEINDMPPNPNQQISKPALAPRPKPWELTQPNTVNGNSVDRSELWWKKKTVSTPEIVSDSSNISGLPPPSQRVWVPPQPSTVAIPEAAAAITYPKNYPSADTTDSNNEDGMDSETNIESNGSKLKGSEISMEPMIEDMSEKEEQGNVEVHKIVSKF